MYFTVSQAAFLLGVCPTTIRRWDRDGKIRCMRTPGGHRRIDEVEIRRIITGKRRRYEKKKRGVAIYSRVSSHDQKKKGDLKRQEARLEQHCRENSLQIVSSYSDVASGLNSKRKGLHRLFRDVCKGKISEVLVTYPDRLTRFGFDYLSSFFGSYGVKIINLEHHQAKDAKDELVDDLIAIITSFSGKIHGMRGRKTRCKKK